MQYTTRWLPLLLIAACGQSASKDAPDAGPGPDAATRDAPPAAVPGQVMTDRGPVIGRDDAVSAFLGIPYAAPPVGALRWRAPEPHAAWTAPREATALGPACAQSEGGLGQRGPFSEDCLTLNVWTPRVDPAARAPVMVFIHGGAFVHGSSNQEGYDGAALAAMGVVVVSMNYRLGAFGFLAHPALTAEDAHGSSGNAGLLDQQAALRWVQTNIAGFGGDPDNTTIFGESAGAMSVCAHIASPLAAGLFRRAIGQSGSCLTFSTPLRAPAGSTRADAESLGTAVADALGCTGAADVLACMRGKPADEVIAAAPGSEEIGGGLTLAPNIDGYVLAEPPAQAYAAGRINAIDGAVGGVNQDEATLFTRTAPVETEAEYAAAVMRLVPDHATEALALYPASAYPTPRDAYNALITDVVFTCPTRGQLRAIAARGATAYLYQLTRPTGFGTLSGLGVYHGSELPFVFGNLTVRSGMSAADRAFAGQVMGYWTRFAATGDPDGAGATEWPPHTAPATGDPGDAYLALGERIDAAIGLRQQTCDAIATWRAP
jgi:para-nitrobenzyl esterase